MQISTSKHYFCLFFNFITIAYHIHSSMSPMVYFQDSFILTSALLFRSPLEGYTLCLPSITSGRRGSAFSFSHAVLQECSRAVPSARVQLPGAALLSACAAAQKCAAAARTENALGPRGSLCEVSSLAKGTDQSL